MDRLERNVVSFSISRIGCFVLLVLSWFLSAELAFAQDKGKEGTDSSEYIDRIEETETKDKVVYQWPHVDQPNFISSMIRWSKETQPTSDNTKWATQLKEIFEERTDRTRSFSKWLGQIDPKIRKFQDEIRLSPKMIPAESFTAHKNNWIRTSLQLYHAVRLAKSSLHDEAALVLKAIDQKFLIDPSTYFFYLGICDRQLIQIESAKGAFRVLLRHEEQLPIRYGALAGMMLVDLEQHKPDSLSEVSRLMADAQRRQSLQRYTSKVLEQEDEIIQSLDKVIEQLEKQQQKMQVASDSRPAGGQAVKPSQSEQAPNGQNAKGVVDSKDQSKEGDWGALQRNAKSIAVSNLVRDLPPHYRTLIEAYFQKLAEEKND